MWQFAQNFDARRRGSLEAVTHFSEIIDRIVASLSVVNFEVCRGKQGLLRQCIRPEFKCNLSRETVDLFFNSPAGYRAQYLFDPEEGQKQNARLIAVLTDRLVAHADANPTKLQMASGSVRLALSACSAKVWLPESCFSFDHQLIEEIVVPRWRLNAMSALEAFRNRTRPAQEGQEKAIWGLRASRANFIEVKGAFLSAEHEEVVACDKISRRHDLFQFGYA